MIHICPDEIGMISALLMSASMVIKPVRECVKCQARILLQKFKKKN